MLESLLKDSVEMRDDIKALRGEFLPIEKSSSLLAFRMNAIEQELHDHRSQIAALPLYKEKIDKIGEQLSAVSKFLWGQAGLLVIAIISGLVLRFLVK